MTLRIGRSRIVSVVLLAVLLSATVIATVTMRGLVRTQNDQLLEERSAEAGLVLSSAISSIKPSLSLLGATYAIDPNSPVASTLVHEFGASAGNAAGVVVPQGARFVVRVAAGADLRVGQVLTGPRATLARRATETRNLVTDMLGTSAGGRSRLAFAVALPTGTVVLEETTLRPSQLTRSQKNSPFQELEGVVYAGPRAVPSDLLLTTNGDRPLSGTVHRQLVPVGADQWLLLTAARHPLVGSLATNAPWIVLALGLLLTLIAFAALEVLLRRRAYALRLVDERTATLRETMTELETARASAEAANQAKSEFLSRMSHELRTPLNAVLGFAQVLELGPLDEPQRQSVAQITKGGRHLLELINDVLDISRIETGNLSLSHEPVLVSDVISDALELIAPLAAPRGITCTALGGPSDATYVLADRQRLKQVLLNLLANAVKYNNANGTVGVVCRTAGERLRIEVTDTGPGIPADRLEEIFEPFERAGADQTNVEGAGIGLALSRRLADAMHATLGVESTPGTGSTFWIDLRVTEGPVERHERITAAAPVAEPAGLLASKAPGFSILYVEDNLANVKLIEQVLAHRSNVHLITAMQGRLGVSLALEHQPELVLLDLHLPDLAGEEVLAELRAHPETATLPVIVLTADATERQRARLLQAGATAYLTKPINVQELLNLVDEYLARGERITRPDASAEVTRSHP